VALIDQRRFDNQRSAYISAAEAAGTLGIKRETLYAYASRGLLRSVPCEHGRQRRYARDDVERLLVRRQARAGHGPVAAGALRWGEPVLESRITSIGPGGPRYRKWLAVDLAEQGVSFERAAELLWAPNEPSTQPGQKARTYPPWGAGLHIAVPVPAECSPITRMLSALVQAASRDFERFDAPDEAELHRARLVLPRLAASMGPKRAHHARASRSQPIAHIVAQSLDAPTDAATLRAIDAALVLSLDHELNTSTFAARVAASAGADLYACLLAGLATLSGPKHGGMCDRIEALLDEVGSPRRAAKVIASRTQRGDVIPGFGHQLYPSGDPRTSPLLRAAALLARPGRPRERVRSAQAVVRSMQRASRPGPAVDFGLVTLCGALGLAPGSATALFAMGRTGGWVAHILEQRAANFLLRPRARYVGGEDRP